jgi:hypothetical protein
VVRLRAVEPHRVFYTSQAPGVWSSMPKEKEQMMDPNATLREMREIAERITFGPNDSRDEETIRLAELVVAIDLWIRGKGALPSAWNRFRCQR